MKTFLLPFALTFAIFCHGQNKTLQYVPSDAPFVLSMNLGNLGKRVNLNTLKQYDFYAAMLKEMEASDLEDEEQKYMHAFLDSPADLGFDLLKPFYFFVKEKGDTTFYTMVMEMGDQPRYETGMMELFPDNFEENFSPEEGYNIFQKGTETYVWNEDVILNIWAEYTPNFDDLFSEENGEWEEYDWPEGDSTETVFIDTMVMDEGIDFSGGETFGIDTSAIRIPPPPPPPPPPGEETWPEPEVMIDTNAVIEDEFGLWGVDTRAASANWAREVMNRQIGPPLSANAKYQTAKAQKADLHFWMDYNYFLEEYKGTMGMGMGMGMGDPQTEMAQDMAVGFVEKLYGDSYVSWGLSFEQGKMALRTQQFFNQSLQSFYAGVKKVKFNKKFFRHIEGGDELFGYAYFNFNIKNGIEEGKTLMHSLLRSEPKYGEAASDAMKILGIFIDEEAIGKLLRGDFLISFSGIQTLEVEETTYDFDEDFNYIEKDTIVQKQVPNVTALATFGNRKDIQKFIDLGLHSEVLVPDGSFFKMDEPTSGLSFYLALHKNMLIFSNNREQLVGSLTKGISKQKRLSKKHRKLLCENASVMYWDVPNTMQQTAPDDGSTPFGATYYVNVFGKQFEDITWKSSKSVNTSLDSQFDVNFKNKNTNSLEQFFIFINDIFLEFQGGAKI